MVLANLGNGSATAQCIGRARPSSFRRASGISFPNLQYSKTTVSCCFRNRYHLQKGAAIIQSAQNGLFVQSAFSIVGSPIKRPLQPPRQKKTDGMDALAQHELSHSRDQVPFQEQHALSYLHTHSTLAPAT
jgi:hypothetical protein